MRIHRNAKTTPATRRLLQQRVLADGWSVRRVARAQGISCPTVYRWLRRTSVEDRSSRPRVVGRRTPAKKVAAILALRHAGWPAVRIARYTQVPRSTVSAVVTRHGLNRLRRGPLGPVQRYERRRVGELVHVDMKRLARIAAPGHRIHGNPAARVRGVGWETVHVCVDDYSRAAYVEVLPDQTAVHTTAFLDRARRWLARRGIRLERVMTDNGPGYRSPRFQHALAAMGARWLRTRPYRPQTNGKAERFIQTMLREWAYGASYATSARRTRALRPWLRHYNQQRPHSALHDRPPISRFPRVAQ